MLTPTFLPPAPLTNSPISPRHLHSRHLQKPTPSLAHHRTRPRWHCALVAVAGATGGVGSLLVQRLLSTASIHTPSTSLPPSLRHINVTAVRALVRSTTRAAAVLPSSPHLQLSRISSIATAPPHQIRAALQHVNVLVICTGTTAFPTKAWANGNTPTSVDDIGVYNLVQAVDKSSIKRVVLMSSIGTTRGKKFPFLILNAFGVIDAKRQGERHVIKAAQEGNFSYAIVRPGRLIGAPHSNIGMVKKEPLETFLDVAIQPGDTLSGDLSRAAAADALCIVTRWDPTKDFDFCLVHREGFTPHIDKWEMMLKTCEIARLGHAERVDGCVDA